MKPNPKYARDRDMPDTFTTPLIVQDEKGRRFWLFRAGFHGWDRPPRWFVHGVFS